VFAAGAQRGRGLPLVTLAGPAIPDSTMPLVSTTSCRVRLWGIETTAPLAGAQYKYCDSHAFGWLAQRPATALAHLLAGICFWAPSAGDHIACLLYYHEKVSCL